MKKELLINLDQLMSKDMPKLMSMVPSEKEFGEADSKDSHVNPFAEHDDTAAQGGKWLITQVDIQSYLPEWEKLSKTNGLVSGKDMIQIIQKYGNNQEFNRQIWHLSDVDRDGKLDKDEYCVCIFLLENKKAKKI
eukprot:TRINITY_DN436_c0_g1_i2.p2 TRINITY_DN436_c0_g1~~TRINITY_DN436_c0_g1_i2.p2  ORF type:complete len:135 (-),score=26.59 TRINITY_DN436_c0_g1_i2:240-644(-)